MKGFIFFLAILTLSVSCQKDDENLKPFNDGKKLSVTNESWILTGDSFKTEFINPSDTTFEICVTDLVKDTTRCSGDSLSFDSPLDSIHVTFNNTDSSFTIAYNNDTSFLSFMSQTSDGLTLKVGVSDNSSNPSSMFFTDISAGQLFQTINGSPSYGPDDFNDIDDLLCPQCGLAIWAIAIVVHGLVEAHCDNVMMQQTNNCIAQGLCAEAGTCEVTCITCP